MVHPDRLKVIPLAPEPISKEDGERKNDYECHALKCLITRLRRDHPRLKLIVLTDSLHSIASIIRELQANQMFFILVAKPGKWAIKLLT